MKHLRNRVRNIYIPKLGDNQKLNQLIIEVVDINSKLESELSAVYDQVVLRKDGKLMFSRNEMINLDRKVLGEIFRKGFDDLNELTNEVTQSISQITLIDDYMNLNVIHQKQKFQRHTIELLTDFAQRNDSNKMHDISKNIKAKLTKTHLELIVIDK